MSTAEPRALTGRTAAVTVGLQIVARGLSVAIAAAITAVVTRAVGVATYADWATALTLVAMLGFMLDPGMSPVVVRRLVQDADASPSLRSMLHVRLGLAAVAVVVAVGAVVATRGIHAWLLATVLAVQLLPRAAVLNAGLVLQLEHRLHRQSFLEVATGACGLAALILLDAANAPAALMAACGITLPLVVLAVVVTRLTSTSPHAMRPVTAGEGDRIRSVLREIAPVAGALIFVSLYTRMQVVFVNAAESERRIAEYLLAFLLVEQLLVVSAIIATTLMPFFADRAKRASLFADPVAHAGLVTLCALGTVVTGLMLATGGPLMALLGGPRLDDAAEFVTLLSPMAAAAFVAIPLGFQYAAMSMSGSYLRFNAIGFAIALALNLTLTLQYGAEAAARTTWITEFCVIGFALAPVWRGAGRVTVATVAGLGALAVAASQAVHAGAPDVLTGLLLIAVAGTVAWQPVARLRQAWS